MGINGMSVKKTMIIGKIARKKLNAILEALDVTEPLKMPSKKNFATWYRGKPSKPGSIMRFDNCSVFKTGLILKILKFFRSQFICI